MLMVHLVSCSFLAQEHQNSTHQINDRADRTCIDVKVNVVSYFSWDATSGYTPQGAYIGHLESSYQMAALLTAKCDHFASPEIFESLLQLIQCWLCMTCPTAVGSLHTLYSKFYLLCNTLEQANHDISRVPGTPQKTCLWSWYKTNAIFNSAPLKPHIQIVCSTSKFNELKLIFFIFWSYLPNWP